MSRKTQLIILTSLVAVLGLVLFLNRTESPTTTNVIEGGTAHSPLITLDNPRLQIEKIDSARDWGYAGTHRNIFSAIVPAPTATSHSLATTPVIPKRIGPDPPPPPPPVVLPVKFFGYATDAQGNHRRAFFTNGDEVYIVGEGEILLGHYRVLRIGNDRVDFEDTTVGRRGSQPMEEGAPSA
ncbi:MAG TPA: hypothetical protein VOA41_17470 [Candidatus Dormibacteraeota bacterium]|nr:hypothetical protein [Candidatus Dormibacteraeota bacterium]